MGKGSFAIFKLSIFVSTWSWGQTSSCEQWDSLFKYSNSNTKEEAFRFLESKPAQKDCFFENCLQLFQQNGLSTLDSVQKLCVIWQTVSKNPCKGKVAYLQFMSSQFSNDIQDRFCKQSHNVYTDCGSSYFSYNLSLHSTLCAEFPCIDLDSLLKTHLITIELEEAKKIANLLAQRNCATCYSFKEANRQIQEKEPNFSALYQLALQYQNEGKWNDAYHYYSQAEKLAESPQQRAHCYLGISKALAKQKNWSKSKDFVLLATQTDPQSQESFVFLTQLLLKAEQMCTFNKEEKTALYLWIARSYIQASNKKEADNYYKKSNVKTIVADKNASSKVLLGCFLNEEVQLKNEKP